jgi:hypothetical protein
VQSAIEIRSVGADWVVHTGLHGSDRRQMHNGIHALHRRLHGWNMPDIALQELNIATEREVATFPGRKIVEYTDRMVLRQQVFNKVRTDKPGAAGDENFHGYP